MKLGIRSLSVSTFVATVLFASLTLSTGPVVHAQALSGIQGTVTDDTGAVVPDAKVTITNNNTGVITRATTSSVGSYTVTDLIPGTYTVKIEKAGFNSWQSTNVVVEAGGKQATADAALKTGATTDIIEVVANPIALETANTSGSTSAKWAKSPKSNSTARTSAYSGNHRLVSTSRPSQSPAKINSQSA